MTGEDGVLARLRRPEYTGENRCGPCTIVNVGVATIGSLQAALWTSVAGATALGVGVAATLFALSIATIWLRGYLIPRTPTLTSRLPDRVLDLFHGTRPPPVAPGLYGPVPDGSGPRGASDRDPREAIDPVDEFDPVDVLADANALDSNRPDSIDDGFLSAWDSAVDERGGDRPALAAAIVDWFAVEDGVTVEERDGRIVAAVDGRPVGVWESRLAVDADLAATGVLDDRIDGWQGLSAARQGRCCVALRARRESCPACGGELSTGVETVESCCADRAVAVAECVACGERLFEARAGAGEATATQTAAATASATQSTDGAATASGATSERADGAGPRSEATTVE